MPASTDTTENGGYRSANEPWRLAVVSDFVFDETTGPRPFGTDTFNHYVTRLLRRARHDGALTEAFFRVFRLERSATSLLRPSVLWRVFRPQFGAPADPPGETVRFRRDPSESSSG